ncbi:hypothetical protein SAMN05216276_1009206 [Streptosporangium subroseum]|uniref:Uncharacterized protein n=1 Tax=Streptosporangium subroseum TaxID=106412 RepID=A0A239EKY2_9ACTN|nr:hypothetical protein SAMN05216276_1009206 [Streptosporangium subroseum]
MHMPSRKPYAKKGREWSPPELWHFVIILCLYVPDASVLEPKQLTVEP